MTAPNAPTQEPPPRGRRIPLLVAGGIASLLAIVLLAAGGLALAAYSEKDEDGYLSTSSERFSSGGRALVSEGLDVDLDGAEALVDGSDLGKVRLDVASPAGKRIFLGVGRTSDVAGYLRDVDHSVVTDVDFAPFHASYGRHDGDRRPAPAAAQGIWAASSVGAGSRKVEWEAEDGDWSIVVMNADGSRGVRADIGAGAKLGFLDELGWGGVGTGALLLIAAGGLALAAMRPPPNQRRPVPAMRAQVG